MTSYALFLLLCFPLLFSIPATHQLQTYQTQVLLQLRKHLEYPQAIEVWDNYSGDLCFLPSSPQMTIVCQGNSITELKIMGDKTDKVSTFEGFAIPNLTLSEAFSMDSFVTTLSRLTTLRVLSLVSLGIWGPLSDKIHRLYSLELLDLSSNFLVGSIPPKISALVQLRSLTLDGNFFSDSVPNWFDSLSNLSILSLNGNQLKGPFPSSICRIKTLTSLALSHNHVSGKLPDMGSLTDLRMLDLRENRLTSEIPRLPKGLVTVLLSSNSFSGEIPQQFGELDQLQHLNLSFNYLTGTPPAAIFSLPNISYLNLSFNKLTGSLPSHLSCSAELGVIDISNNRLTGGLPTCLSSQSDKRVVMFGGNCLSVDPQHQHPESYCKEIHMMDKESGGMSIGVLIGVIGGAVTVVILLAFGFLILSRRYCPRGTSERHLTRKAVPDRAPTGYSSELLANARLVSEAAKLGTQGVPTYRVFSLEELNEATNNFDQSTFMGEGSMGKLFKGWLENGTFVAIRCLTLSKRFPIRNLKLRLDLIGKLRHPHLVCLLGHCIDGVGQDDCSVNKVFLIYEYVANGNLRTHLSEDSPGKVLKWSERLAVLIGVAKAVHFLHTGIIPGLFNNRLKTNNVLLDEHQIAKLSDYGLSIITDEIIKLEVKGEGQKLQRKKLEDDVYSFGFILLEALVGPSVSGRGEAFLLNEMASFGSQDGRKRIVDPVVLTTCSEESLSIVISITKKCISPESSSRPSFEDVLWNLQYASQVQATADGDQRSDATSQTSISQQN
ncbi:PREDICTED: probable inactive leucine-rich repeat receptor-like protein kinase At3g03770 [Nelumbo nucifera]|uniref:Probable inactive leucine-rich repeat receptor-like protein kinase At3g03770 n=1 Tax=Nelumbo nucifera TaxID=4432 RepID=A0A1U7ZH30_NELNU|nr:PREDICTED: probable inactive leucine-rich repeat receptor-like protein kinase At3g03770 [Nelumbo nucifera]